MKKSKYSGIELNGRLITKMGAEERLKAIVELIRVREEVIQDIKINYSEMSEDINARSRENMKLREFIRVKDELLRKNEGKFYDINNLHRACVQLADGATHLTITPIIKESEVFQAIQDLRAEADSCESARLYWKKFAITVSIGMPCALGIGWEIGKLIFK